MRVAVVIPAYNEARRLPATLLAWRDYLAACAFEWELIVVDDGSRDETATVADAMGARVVRLRPNRGKGCAVKAGVLAASADAEAGVLAASADVKAGVLAASADAIAYVDADLNIAPSHLAAALQLLEDGADLVAGRRDLGEYAAAEGPIRLLAGGLVQLTRRALVMSAIRDTQCGFKVFRADVARAVFSRTRICSFAFDIEVLFLARRLGARIVEMPVSTTYRAESTFSVRKHLPTFLADIARIRLNAISGLYSA